MFVTDFHGLQLFYVENPCTQPVVQSSQVITESDVCSFKSQWLFLSEFISLNYNLKLLIPLLLGFQGCTVIIDQVFHLDYIDGISAQHTGHESEHKKLGSVAVQTEKAMLERYSFLLWVQTEGEISLPLKF